MQEGKTLDYMRFDFPELYLSFYQSVGNPVHDSGKQLGTKRNLKAHQRQHHQCNHPQQSIPYDFPGLHLTLCKVTIYCDICINQHKL